MKKILFIMKYPLTESYSILQKFDGQMQAVRNLGYDVFYISFDKDYLYLNHGNEKKPIKRTTWGKSRLYFHLLSFYDIYTAANKLIKGMRFDVVYFRYGPLNLFGNRLFKTAKKYSKLVVEIPTFPSDREKQKTALRRAYLKYSNIWWKLSAPNISLFSLIGEKADAYLNVPAINISNGIAVEKVPLKSHGKDDGKIHLLAVASMCDWHGYDRVIRGLAQWKDPEKANYILDLAGRDGDGSLERWKKLTRELHLEENVVFHGHVTGDALTDLFETATVGVCSLGMYRKGFAFSSELKLREYMARGLPFICAHADTDTPEDMPWCLKIDNNDSPVPMDKVKDFACRVKGDESLSKTMRAYALKNMTWESQFKEIFKRLEECI